MSTRQLIKSSFKTSFISILCQVNRNDDQLSTFITNISALQLLRPLTPGGRTRRTVSF